MFDCVRADLTAPPAPGASSLGRRVRKAVQFSGQDKFYPHVERAFMTTERAFKPDKGRREQRKHTCDGHIGLHGHRALFQDGQGRARAAKVCLATILSEHVGRTPTSCISAPGIPIFGDSPQYTSRSNQQQQRGCAPSRPCPQNRKTLQKHKGESVMEAFRCGLRLGL